MSKWPTHRPTGIGEYFGEYMVEMARASGTVSRDSLARAVALLQETLASDGSIFSCGNGGSAAIANHLVCDYGKGLRSDTALKPRVRSLSAGPEILTAIGNDLSYADVFAHQLDGFARRGDLLIAISSSGNSENIVRAVQWCRDNGVGTIVMTGFAGGRAAPLADVNLHVASENYGIVEDLHQSLMHTLAQYVRVTTMPDELIAQRKF